jgi:hypothetical protein
MNRHAHAYQMVLLTAAASAIAAELGKEQDWKLAIASARRDLDDLARACEALERGFAGGEAVAAWMTAHAPATAPAPAPPPAPIAQPTPAKPKRRRGAAPAGQIFDEVT